MSVLAEVDPAVAYPATETVPKPDEMSPPGSTAGYNPRRRHSTLDMMSPIDYENTHHRRHTP